MKCVADHVGKLVVICDAQAAPSLQVCDLNVMEIWLQLFRLASAVGLNGGKKISLSIMKNIPVVEA